MLLLTFIVLDDNTYTNKTWAEVSGISVQEIHIMEVEFLSNMRYTLYVSDKEWEAWHIKLGLFWSYFAKASKKPMEIESRRQGIEAPPNLNFSSNSSNLPSPPGSNHTSPPYSTSQSFGHTALPHPLSIPPYLPPSAPSPLSQLPAVDARFSARKRSRDEDSYEPPPKRPALPSSISSSATVTPSTIRGSNPPAPRLPMPNLSISTSGQSNSYNYSHGTQLPAPNRSSNGQTPGSSRWPQSNQLPSLPQPSPFPPSSANFPGNADWQNRQSPYGAGSATPSPTSYHFPQSQHTPTHLSPRAIQSHVTHPTSPSEVSTPYLFLPLLRRYTIRRRIWVMTRCTISHSANRASAGAAPFHTSIQKNGRKRHLTNLSFFPNQHPTPYLIKGPPSRGFGEVSNIERLL